MFKFTIEGCDPAAPAALKAYAEAAEANGFPEGKVEEARTLAVEADADRAALGAIAPEDALLVIDRRVSTSPGSGGTDEKQG